MSNSMMVTQSAGAFPMEVCAPINKFEVIKLTEDDYGDVEPVVIGGTEILADSLIVHIDLVRGAAFLMNIRTKPKKPKKVAITDLVEAIQRKEVIKVSSFKRSRTVHLDDLSEKELQLASKRFAVIKTIGDLDEFFANNYGKGIIVDAAEKHGYTEPHVYNIIWTYLYNECCYASLGKGLGESATRVPKKERNVTKPLGRRSDIEKLLGEPTRKMLTPEDFENFRWAVKQLTSNTKLRLRSFFATYDHMINKRYSYLTGVYDNSLVADTGSDSDNESFEEHLKPSYGQFYYWLTKEYGPKKTALRNAQMTNAECNNNFNGHHGHAFTNLINVGQRLEFDETPFDEELVSSFDATKRVGKITLYVLRCAVTRYIFSFHVTFSAPSVEQAATALYQCFRSKADWLESLGLPEYIDEWKHTGLPESLAVDNAEFNNTKSEYIAKTLGIRLDFSKSGQGKDKPFVESAFKILVGNLPNLSRGHKSESPSEQRSNTARRYASLIRQELVKILMETIIHHNNFHINKHIQLPREATDDGVSRIPKDLFRWSVENSKSCLRTNYTDEDLRKSLLPRGDVTVYKKGIRLLGMGHEVWFSSNEIRSLGYQNRPAKGRSKSSRFKCSYDPDNLSKIWIYIENEVFEAVLNEKYERYKGLNREERAALNLKQLENEHEARQAQANSKARLFHSTQNTVSKAEKRRKANQGNLTASNSETTENRKFDHSHDVSPMHATDSDVPLSNQDSGHNKNNNTTTKHTSWKDEE